MSGRKSKLPKYQIVTNGDMSQAQIISDVTNVELLDAIGIQLNWSGAPVGTFEIQISSDYEKDSQGNVINAGNWIPLDFSPAAETVLGSPIFVDIAITAAPWIRTVYTRTSGSGTLNAFITAKMI